MRVSACDRKFLQLQLARQKAELQVGYGGNGITYGVIAAEIIRDLCLGRANTDASIFCFDR